MNEGVKLADKAPTEIDKFIEGFKKANTEYRQNLDWLGRIARKFINEPSPTKGNEKEKMPSSGHLSTFIDLSVDYSDCNNVFAAMLASLDKIV